MKDFRCTRTPAGRHRWNTIVGGEAGQVVCTECGNKGMRVGRSVVQPGQSTNNRLSQRRQRTAPRARTISATTLSQRDQRQLEQCSPAAPYVPRPLKRGECVGDDRPCPWISCRHHLYLDVNPFTGSIKFNFPDLEPHELVESCSLDVAGRGGLTLDEVGLLTNITRERVRQIEVRALLEMKIEAKRNGIEDAAWPTPLGFDHPDAPPVSPREESAKRARAAYIERKRAAKAAEEAQAPNESDEEEDAA